MKNVLYISLTGITEPLGQSQVLEYLIDLSEDNNIYLLSYERKKDLDELNKVKSTINENNIKWRYLEYSNKYGVFSTIMQLVVGFSYTLKVMKSSNIDIIHTRSFIPAVLGLLLKKLFSKKLIYDIRGFSIDEKIDQGRLSKKSFLYKILKSLDAYIYKNSDFVVTLTHKAKKILIEEFKLSENIIEVIPTCANEKLFTVLSDNQKKSFRIENNYELDDKIIIHTGNVQGWYDFEKEVQLVKKLIEMDDKIRFLVLNKNQHEYIFEVFTKYSIDKKYLKVLSASFEDVHKYLNISNCSLFFITPSYSKLASAPTKFAENVACLLPSITNSNVGDMNYYIEEFDVGFLFDLNDFNNIESKLLDILEKINNKDKDSNVYNQLFYNNFKKELAIEKYRKIYKELLI